MQDIVQPITVLHNTVTSIQSTLCLHTKDMPSHRRRFYTHNLNETELRKLQNSPQNINVFLTTQFYFITCNFNRNTVVYLNNI